MATRRQRGYVALIILLIVIMGSLAAIVGQLPSTNVFAGRTQAVHASLATARDALMAYAITYRDTHPGEAPGYLPCPDKDGDGSADALDSDCGGTDGKAVVGLLPYKQLGLGDLRDAHGNCLWYAVSGSFKASTNKPAPMNWDTQGQFAVRDANGNVLVTPEDAFGGAAAVIFSPGPPLAGQQRTPLATTNTCNVDPQLISAHLDDINAFSPATGTVTVKQGAIVAPGQAGTAINDQLVWITPKEIWDSFIKRTDFGNALTATPPGQINRLADEIRAVIEKQMQDDLVAGGTPTSSSLPINTASYTQFSGKSVGDLASLSPYDPAYTDYFTNWREQFRQATCSNLDTACLTVAGTSCRGALMFGGRTNDGRPRTASQKPPYPPSPPNTSWTSFLGSYFESGLEILTSGMTFSGNTAYTASSPDADVGTCLFKGSFISFPRDIAAFAAGQALSAGGVSPVASVTTTPGSEAVNLGSSSLYARSGCVWYPTPLSLDTSLRLYFMFRIESAASAAPGFALAIADSATNSITDPNRPVMCGSPSSSRLGYAGAPVEGNVTLPDTTILPIAAASWSSTSLKATITTSSAHGLAVGNLVTITDALPASYNGTLLVVTDVPSSVRFRYALATNPGQATAGIRPPKVGIEFDTDYDSLRADTASEAEHFAFLHWGAASDNDPAGTDTGNDDNTHGNGVSGNGSQPLNPGSLTTTAATATPVATLAAAQWSGGTVTATTADNHGFSTGQSVTISDVLSVGYKGTYTVTVIDATHFTYALAADPGTYPSNATSAVMASPVSSSTISGATWANSISTITTAAAHGLATGQAVNVAGVYPAGYNGVFPVTVIDATHFTYALAVSPGGTFSATTFATPGIAVVASSDAYLPYNGAMPLSTDLHVRLDLTRGYDATRHQATLTLKAYVGSTFTATCSLENFKNLARDLSALCPGRSAQIAQDGIVINDVSGPALAGIYVGFTNARGVSSSDNQTVSITNLMMRSQ